MIKKRRNEGDEKRGRWDFSPDETHGPTGIEKFSRDKKYCLRSTCRLADF
jgi:hypothetical protein